jgi:hypothetical protein
MWSYAVLPPRIRPIVIRWLEWNWATVQSSDTTRHSSLSFVARHLPRSPLSLPFLAAISRESTSKSFPSAARGWAGSCGGRPYCLWESIGHRRRRGRADRLFIRGWCGEKDSLGGATARFDGMEGRWPSCDCRWSTIGGSSSQIDSSTVWLVFQSPRPRHLVSLLLV